MVEFMVDIRGRVNNTPLPDSKYLWALLESIVNSIQSIEEADISNGIIEVYAERQDWEQISMDIKESHMQGVDLKPEKTSFVSFRIMDNGYGFTSENYKSFRTADSSLKWKKGCKGIGRFLWLKAFEKAKIESNFFEDEKWYKRVFEFTLDGIEPTDNITESEVMENNTTVVLEWFKSPYRNRSPKSLDVLARKIIEHCLIYFLLGKCPRINIRDSLGELINLNQYYDSFIRDSLHQDHFHLDDDEFIIIEEDDK